MTAPGAGRGLAAVSWGVVLPAALAQSLALTLGNAGATATTATSLYFRMLPPAWGYVDQPPLVPFLARTLSGVVDEPWALRLPATLASALSVILVGLVTRDLGGQRGAQALAAWGYAFSSLPLMLGHVLLTSTLDQAFWLAVVFAVLRALRGSPRWWLVAGAVAGLASYSRLLVAVLGAALAVGILTLGPRATLRSPWLWAGRPGRPGRPPEPGLPGDPRLAAPGHGRGPVGEQCRRGAGPGAAAAAAHARPRAGGRVGAGLVWLLRRERRADVGFLAVAFGVLVAFTLDSSGAQPHYPVHLLSVVYAAGCVPVAAWLAPRAGWRRVAVAGLALNAAFFLVLALPVVPVGSVGATPLPDIGPLVADQVGWPRYVAQVTDVYRSVPTGEQPVVITSNYGEAGALARFGRGLAAETAQRPERAVRRRAPGRGHDVVVMVGYHRAVERLFASCDVAARLDNGVGVDNEEQDAPVAVCRGPVAPWSEPVAALPAPGRRAAAVTDSRLCG